jgi:hypothetical protein
MTSLRKDASVWTMIAGLMQHLDSHEVDVIDHWEAGLFVIGFACAVVPSRLLYVSTWRPPAGHFACELDVDDQSIGEKRGMKAGGRGVTLEVLAEVVRRHLWVDTAADRAEA